MVNTAAFSKRLAQILAHYGLSAASFAEAIKVNRSSISHLLSGRNKPSLDFVLKVIQAYPEVELYWLLNGKGNFPKSDTITQAEVVGTTKPKTITTVQETVPDASTLEKNKDNPEIERIVIFYKDGTFSTYRGK